MNKQLFVFGLVIALFVGAKDSYANPAECFAPYLGSHNSYVIKYIDIRYKNALDKCYRLVDAPLITPLLNDVFNIRYFMTQSLRADFDSIVREKIGGSLKVKSTYLRLAGDLSFEIQGIPNSDGDVAIIIGGPSVTANARVKKSPFLDGEISFRTQPISIRGTYNVFSGLIDDLNIANLNPSINIDIDSNFDFLFPGITYGISNWAESIAKAEIQQHIKQGLNQLADTSYTVFGLGDKIPLGQYYYQGEDIGLKVKTEIAKLTGYLSFKIIQSGDNDIRTTSLSIVIPNQNIHFKIGSEYIKSAYSGCLPRCYVM